MRGKKLKILKDVLGRCHQSGADEYLFPCPFCDHRKRKLSVNIEKSFYKCWICNAHGRHLSWIIQRFGDESAKQEWSEFEVREDVDVGDFEMLFEAPERFVERTMDLPLHYLSLTSKTLPRGANGALKYLRERGVVWEDIVRWKIGYCSEGEYSGRIIIPSFNESGYVNYFIARSYGSEWPAYKNPQANRDIIFNELYVNWEEDVVLVEGVFDAINAGNAIPLLGSTLRENSKLYQEIVKRDINVYVALDADAKKKASRIANSLLMYDVTVYLVDTSGYDDVGQMSKDTFAKRKEKANIMNSHYYLYTRFLDL